MKASLNELLLSLFRELSLLRGQFRSFEFPATGFEVGSVAGGPGSGLPKPALSLLGNEPVGAILL